MSSCRENFHNLLQRGASSSLLTTMCCWSHRCNHEKTTPQKELNYLLHATRILFQKTTDNSCSKTVTSSMCFYRVFTNNKALQGCFVFGKQPWRAAGVIVPSTEMLSYTICLFVSTSLLLLCEGAMVLMLLVGCSPSYSNTWLMDYRFDAQRFYRQL